MKKNRTMPLAKYALSKVYKNEYPYLPKGIHFIGTVRILYSHTMHSQSASNYNSMLLHNMPLYKVLAMILHIIQKGIKVKGRYIQKRR